MTAEYNMATAYIVGRWRRASSARHRLLVRADRIMLAVIGLIQFGVGERKLGRRETVALQGAA